MLLSIPMDMTMHFFHPHPMVILSPIHTGLQKRRMRLIPTPPLEPTLLCYNTWKDKLKAHISKHPKLGDAKTDSGCYDSWMTAYVSESDNKQFVMEHYKNNCITGSECHEIQNSHSSHS